MLPLGYIYSLIHKNLPLLHFENYDKIKFFEQTLWYVTLLRLEPFKIKNLKY